MNSIWEPSDVNEHLRTHGRATPRRGFSRAKLLLLAAITLCGVGSAETAHAQATTYQYTGVPYIILNPHLAPGCNVGSVCTDFTNQERTTGSFTTSAPLGPNFSGIVTTLVSYSFSDGIDTIASADANSAVRLFLASTDGNGVPTLLNVQVQDWIGSQTQGTPNDASNNVGRFNYITITEANVSSLHNSLCLNTAQAIFGTALICTGFENDSFTSEAVSGPRTSEILQLAPTLGGWGMLALAGLFAATGWRILSIRRLNRA